MVFSFYVGVSRYSLSANGVRFVDAYHLFGICLFAREVIFFREIFSIRLINIVILICSSLCSLIQLKTLIVVSVVQENVPLI